MEEKEEYVLTEWAIMQQVLCDFGIIVNKTVANAVFEELMRRLVESGYLNREIENKKLKKELEEAKAEGTI